ncbi:MAG: hypothetical protein ACLSXF_04185 [Clostridium sp.]|jgi:hypothetical protein|nr:hypothetical protein [uncultured Intestinibacter sp.]DAE59001.1 MAG TPA: putative tail fiber protein [Caudoviricetes sp.]
MSDTIYIKVNGKFIPLGVQLAGIINLNSIEVDDSDNIKNQDNCSVKLPGGMIIKTFQVTYSPDKDSYHMEKEFTFKKAFQNACVCVTGGAISNGSNLLAVNAIPKSKSSCLLTATQIEKQNIIGDVTFYMTAIGY